MRHLLGSGLVLLLVLWSSLLWAAETRQGIVVWRIEKKAGVTEQDIDSLSGYIASEVERASGLHAISDSDISTILKGEQTKQQCGGEASSCVAEIGAALGVPLAVAGDLGKVDKYWFLNIKLINVHSAQVERRVSRKLSGSLGDLIDALPGAINELFKEKQLKPPVKAAAPVVAPAPTPAPATAPASAEKPAPVAPEPVAPAAKPAAPAKPLSTLSKAAFASFFSGVGLVVIGGISQWQMGKAKDSYDASRGSDSGAKSRHSAFKALTFVGYGLGGAGLIAGAVLWIVDAKQKPNPAVSLGVAPGPKGASVTLVGRW